jgi:hypothetical protein
MRDGKTVARKVLQFWEKKKIYSIWVLPLKKQVSPEIRKECLQGCLGKRKICTGTLHWKRSKGWLTYGEKITLKVSKENCYTHVCDLELA